MAQCFSDLPAKSFVLGISTSSGIAQVCALAMPAPEKQATPWAQMQVLFEFEISDYKQQSLELLPRLLQHMAQAGLTGAQCQGIACNIGPGGFTSLRTACGVAQGLATAWACGVVAVSSFECMAAEFVLQGGRTDQPLACYIDARLQEFYSAVLSNASGSNPFSGFDMLRSPCQIPATGQALSAFSEGAGFATATPSIEPFHLIEQSAFKILEESGFDLNSISHQIVNPGAHGLAVLGVLAAQAGQLSEPLVLQPLYVREKVAQTTSERMAARNVGV